MRPDLIVFDDPIIGYLTDFRESTKNIKVQNLISIGSIEPFNERVLGRLSGLDKFKRDIVFFSPGRQFDRERWSRLFEQPSLVI